MKRFLLIFILVICVATHSLANFESHPNLFGGLGIQTYYFDYEEPGIMEQEGYYLGFTYQFGYQKDKWFLKADGMIAPGLVDYESAQTGSLDGERNITFEIRGIGGYVILEKGATKITPFIGIGYHFLENKSELKQSTTGHYGYDRESHYCYIPIGVTVEVGLGNGWRLVPEVEYDYFITGQQDSRTGYLSGYTDVSNDQDSGYGYRFSLGFAKQMKQFDLLIRFFFRYWDINDSDVTIDPYGRGWIEPDNETHEYGIECSFIF
ncbi:MAG: hypothetical protein GY729_20600 [Desulfobacteraceae bacterium]|nr:hypothetical protein [Desulfobacteraceae bacterium]